MTRPSTNLLVLGARGMVGQAAVRALARPGPVIASARDGADGYAVEQGEAPLRRLLDRVAGGLVVNAVGVRADAIDAADAASVDRAMAVNGTFPHALARLAGETGCRVVTVSSDAVFPRAAGEVDETAAPAPEDAYGRSKLAGEPDAAHCLVVRCSVVGPDPAGRHGLWQWLVDRPVNARVEGYTDQRWSGCTARQLAAVFAALADAGTFAGVRAGGPVHHFAPNPVVTKYDLLTALAAELRPDVTVAPTQSGAPADRVLVSREGRLAALVAPSAGWRAEIAACARDAAD